MYTHHCTFVNWPICMPTVTAKENKRGRGKYTHDKNKLHAAIIVMFVFRAYLNHFNHIGAHSHTHTTTYT